MNQQDLTETTNKHPKLDRHPGSAGKSTLRAIFKSRSLTTRPCFTPSATLPKALGAFCLLFTVEFALNILAIPALTTSTALAKEEYLKATTSKEVIKKKLFPKKGKVEINGPNAGVFLNQSYINSIVLHGGITYFTSETWGFSAEGLYSINADKGERTVIESFYNDQGGEAAGRFGPPEGLEGTTLANYGPAYVPIREINYALAATAVWNPVYGKQLFFLSATGYFDLFVTMGAGLIFSSFYPERIILDNGNISRGQYTQKGTIGAEPSEVNSHGTLGRPIPEESSHFMFTFGVGQKYHFAKRFNIKAEVRNYTLFGTDAGFDIFFALTLGVGVRI